jgi:predicted lipid-binding transport protein (Tim44 family)
MDSGWFQFFSVIIIFITLIASGFIIPMWLINYNLILHFKSRKIKRRIKKYSAEDPFWNHGEMMNIGKDMFLHIQHAWHNGHFRHLSGSISNNQKMEWQHLWKYMHKLGFRFAFISVQIEKVYIIGAIDHYDNEKDIFQIAIAGSIKRYVQYRKNGRLVEGNSRYSKNFVDILVFKRIDNKWLLDEMKVDASLFHVLKTPDKDFNMQNGEA